MSKKPHKGKHHGHRGTHGAAPLHPVIHGHQPQRHGELPSTHSHGPAAADFHFSAPEEQAMREGNEAPGGPGGGEPDMDDMG